MKGWKCGVLGSLPLAFSLLVGATVGCSVSGESDEFDDTNSPGGGGQSGDGQPPGQGAGATDIADGTGNAGGEGDNGDTGGESGFEECDSLSQTATNKLQPADIIFAIDSSGSMGLEMAAVQTNMNAFSAQIAASGIDTHIVLIAQPPGLFNIPPGICIEPPLGAGTCPGSETNPAAGYWHLPDEVGSHDALNLIRDTYDQWQGVLRPEATKAFVVVSDDDQSSFPYTSANSWTQAINALPEFGAGTWKFHSIYCFTDCWLVAANVGDVYKDLVAQTGGIGGDLCLQNFAPVFDAIAAGVIEGAELQCEWDIPPAPTGETFDKGKLNIEYTPSTGPGEDILHVPDPSVCGTEGGWYYDDNQNPTKVFVCPSTCDRIQADSGGKIDVLFGCKTRDVVK